MAKKEPRDKELSGDKKTKDRLLKLFDDVDQGYQDQWDRTNAHIDYWEMYNCKLGAKQSYNGNAQIFVPIVHDALNARMTRFVNQIFPKNGRFVEVVGANAEEPSALTALCEHYVRRAKLRTEVAPALVLNGDIEGQYNVYVRWQDDSYDTTTRVERPVKLDGEEVIEAEPEIEDIETEEQYDAGPAVEVIPDSDILILPATSDSIADALSQGGSVTIIRRWTKDTIQGKIDEGLITEEAGKRLMDSMSKVNVSARNDTKKVHADAAGIKTAPLGGRYALVYETWTMLKVGDGKKLCRAFYAGDQNILGCKRNPYWYDRVPLLSAPRKKISGVVKGRSAVEPVATLQYYANDIYNEGADSATYAMLPIIMTDPEKNPRVGTMVLDLAAVWETSPKDTQFAQFPPLYQQSLEIVANVTGMVFQNLSVNSSMIPQQTGVTLRRKMNQAEIAQEQQVDILSTSDAVTVIEQGVLNDLVTWFMWLDHQFRDEEITIRAFGQMGLMARMEKIPPIKMGNAISFRWFGVEAARDAAEVQQKIAFVNVLRGIPPNLYPNHKMDLVPVLEQACESVFGPRLAPLVFKDMRQELTVAADMENELLLLGYDLSVHPMDDDVQHIEKHMEIAEPDEHGTVRVHIARHQKQMQEKAMMQAMQAQQMPGMPGTPGGIQGQPPGPQGPGVAGAPRPGAQPMPPRGNYQPPGMIARDSLPAAGAIPMPRKY